MTSTAGFLGEFIVTITYFGKYLLRVNGYPPSLAKAGGDTDRTK
jgi:hypothetical protein